MHQLMRMLPTVIVTLMVSAVWTAAAPAAHPYHASIAEVEWNRRSGCLEVALRVNSLMLERALTAATGTSVNLERTANAETLVRDYVAERFRVTDAAERSGRINWVGMELEKLDLWTYFELELRPPDDGDSPAHGPAIRPALTVDSDRPGPADRSSAETARDHASSGTLEARPADPGRLTVTNTVLFDAVPEQMNFVSLRVGTESQSAHFTRDQPTSALVFENGPTDADGTPPAGREALVVHPTSFQEAAGPSETQDGFPAVPGMQRTLTTRFDDQDSLAQWEFTDASAWEWRAVDGTTLLSLKDRRSDFSPPHRSPFNRALLKGTEVGSFVMDVRLRSTIPDYNHRDLCLFFGYQDDAHLYYVHLGKRTDDHASQVFIVNDAPRTKISTRTSDGIPWDDDWHHVRVVRDIESGAIEVFFDDLSRPVMTANDRTFGVGRIGVGSFDDTGDFDVVTLWTPAAE